MWINAHQVKKIESVHCCPQLSFGLFSKKKKGKYSQLQKKCGGKERTRIYLNDATAELHRGRHVDNEKWISAGSGMYEIQ
jgi:hypothetical protein